jgi:hypothetical protein
VSAAVADFRKRTAGEDHTIDIGALKDDLQNALASAPYRGDLGSLDWTHVPTPWRVAAGVHQLLLERKFNEAADLATLDRHWHELNGDTELISLSNALERRVQDAAAKQ